MNVNVTTILILRHIQDEFFEDFLKAWWVQRVSGRWKERDARVAINLCACCREIELRDSYHVRRVSTCHPRRTKGVRGNVQLSVRLF